VDGKVEKYVLAMAHLMGSIYVILVVVVGVVREVVKIKEAKERSSVLYLSRKQCRRVVSSSHDHHHASQRSFALYQLNLLFNMTVDLVSPRSS
jgi:hypothetical protein